MSRQEDFMRAEDHFAYFISLLPLDTQHLYHATKHIRIETGYKGRNFILYQMDGPDVHELDRVVVLDFNCDEREGASSQVELLSTGETMLLDYSPRQLFHFPVFMWLPLAGKVRWGATASRPTSGSLGFPIAIRTKTRQDPREPGAVHCETAADYAREFGGLSAK